MQKSASSSSPVKSPSKESTRYGPVRQIQPKFGTEKRFQWQNSENASDVAYTLPEMRMTKSVIFGSSLRGGDDNPDAKTRSNGPGSYDISHAYDHLSEYGTKNGNKFACAPRQSMAMKTASPGAVYNIDKVYYLGPTKNDGIGFSNSSRQNLFDSSAAANSELFFPKKETGPAITIAKRFKTKTTLSISPGPVYDVHKKVDFRTGPKYSFGMGRGTRFNTVAGLLPDDYDENKLNRTI